jgi:hypothetical protein
MRKSPLFSSPETANENILALVLLRIFGGDAARRNSSLIPE